MRGNDDLHGARRARSDEFYTRFEDVQAEVQAYRDHDPDVFRGKTILLPCDDPEWSAFTQYFAAGFDVFGIEKLISTAYAPGGRGKVFVLERGADMDGDGRVDLRDLQWEYLEGDGDFRSAEVRALRDEADMVITNPPFSLFREFLAWIVEADKQFLILGNMNAITYKEVWPLIQSDRMWYGPSISSGDREFGVPDDYPLAAAGWRVDEAGRKYIRVKGVRWFTNLDHGRRHQPLALAPEAEVLAYHKNMQGKDGFDRYDNYDAIEVPRVMNIPSDYDGVMGVPISFLDKYCPEQFEIVGGSANGLVPDSLKLPHFKKHNEPFVNGKKVYQRTFIKHRPAGAGAGVGADAKGKTA